MAPNHPRVIVGVAEHWILGTLPLDGTRIQDRLNDPRSDFIELTSVEVHPCSGPKCLARQPQLVVPKSGILFVAAHLQHHEAPDGRLNHFANKNNFQVFATLSHYRISGAVHLPTFSADALHAMSHQLRRFFPVTEATINGHGVCDYRAALLIANKDFVDCFHAGQQTPADGETEAVEHLHALVG